MEGKIAVLILSIMLISNISFAIKPDIYVKNATIYPEKIYEGDEVKVNFTVGNSGNEKLNFEIALFVDNRSKVIDRINVSLNAGESKEESLYWIAEKGHHTIFIFADYNNMINEENEDNNIISIDVNVLKPQYLVFPPPPQNATWWDERWHYRFPLAVSMFGKRAGYIYENKMVYCNVNFTSLMNKISYLQTGTFSKRTFYPNSVRVIEYECENNTWKPIRSVGREIVFSNDYDAIKNANVTIKWVMENGLKPHERRYYYIYWDTVENGYKKGEYGKIYSGIKNCEFEIKSNQWKNYTSGAMKWKLGYSKDPLENDGCYRINAKGIYGYGRIWINDCYAKISQSFKVPDEGQSYYIFHGKVYVYSDIDIFEWEIAIEGKVIATGKTTSGWKEISKNITSYLKGKSSSLISFTIKITQSQIFTNPHEISAYLDSFWIETEKVEVSQYKNYSQGWDGNVYGIEKEYIAGVEGKNSLNFIGVNTLAEPKEVVAKLYSPKSKLVKSTMPFPDPSFEEDYTDLFISDKKTCFAEIQDGIVHSGNKAIELKLANYEGKFKIENEKVKATDIAGMRQNITYGIQASYIPSLYFWYKVDKFSSSSYLNYTLLTVGSSPCFYTIHLSNLINDGSWHKYKIPNSILSSWRKKAGKIIGIEIRLVAGAAEAEDTIYIDDIGYSFTPKNSIDRTKWEIKNFYNFTNGENVGNWRLDVIMEDASDYRITKSIIIKVYPSADLDVYKIDYPKNLKEGENGKFIVYVKNNGPKSIDENTPINVSLSIYQKMSNPIKMRKSIAGLKKGESKKIEFEWIASYGNASYNGSWNVIAKVNEENSIPEWNKMNNWYVTTIKVEARPDMEICMDDVSFYPSHPMENESINISVIVHNIGYKAGDAKLKLYEKKVNERKYILIQNESMEKIIGKQSFEKFIIKWDAVNGTYNIKIEVECSDEINKKNNLVIKDIKVGGAIDTNPPIIKNIRANPSIAIGEKINVSATIYDDETSIDRAIIHLLNESIEKTFVMKRMDETNLYYSCFSINRIGEYEFYIEAFDTANFQNRNESNKNKIRIIYKDIETNPPVIRGITFPERQVINEKVNVSAYIDDESGIYHSYIYIIKDGNKEKHEMFAKNGSKIYYYEGKYGIGKYKFYIEAIDNSANKNKNVSDMKSFEIPDDYDMDDVPDNIEIDIGANPKNANETINVSIGNEIGYLIWIEKENRYIYWNKGSNATREVGYKDVNGDGNIDILFDADGDGTYDHYYDKIGKDIGLYKMQVKKESEIIWIAPPALLFIIVGIGFILLRKK